MGGRIGIITLITMFLLSACIAPQSAYMASVDARSWHSAEMVTYINSDTLTLRDLNIVLRHNSNFKESVLPLKIVITTPDARYFEEIREVQLQPKSSTSAVATTNSIPYRTNVLLAQKGCYIFSFEPLTEIRGVESIGVEFTTIKD